MNELFITYAAMIIGSAIMLLIIYLICNHFFKVLMALFWFAGMVAAVVFTFFWAWPALEYYKLLDTKWFFTPIYAGIIGWIILTLKFFIKERKR